MFHVSAAPIKVLKNNKNVIFLIANFSEKEKERGRIKTFKTRLFSIVKRSIIFKYIVENKIAFRNQGLEI